MIRSPLEARLANHFEGSGSGGPSASVRTNKMPSPAELAYQDLQGGNWEEYGIYDGLLFICIGDEETVVDMRRPEAEPVRQSPPVVRTTVPESKVPAFLIPEPAGT